MAAKPKIPPEWKPAIKAIMVGSHGAITREAMVTYLGNYLGVQISESRIRQIMYDYDKIDGKVQKAIAPRPSRTADDEVQRGDSATSFPSQRKGDDDALG